MEQNKWYKLTSGQRSVIDPWYIKLKTISDNNNIQASEHLTDNKIFRNGGNFGKVGYYTFTPINLSEIQQYLPDNHPDKLPQDNLIANIL